VDPAIRSFDCPNPAIHLMPLTERVLATVRRHDLIPAGTRVLAAVSGGADSVALALVLARLAPVHGFTMAGLAHLNHGLRGEAASADEAFVAALAARLGVPFVPGREDVAARAAESRESIEAAARRARYKFLEAAASGLDAARIATGHTADDQAETVLLRLMRGAGLEGLSGIRPRNGAVIRPLLDARRAEIEAFLREAGERWCDDASNADRAIVRNRVRHDVLPAMNLAAGYDVVDALARTAGLIRDDADEMGRRAIEMSARAVLTDGSLDIAQLDAAGPAMARRIIRGAVDAAAGGRFHALEHVEAVRSLMKEDSPARVQLPGVTAVRDSGRIRLEPAAGIDGPGHPVGFETRLPVPGTAAVPHSALVVSAEVGAVDAAGLADMRARSDVVAVQGVHTATLTVRSRRPGDALRPLGAPGRRKLQDVFVDNKIARAERDRVPLVVDDQGRIIWVIGHTIADEFRVTTPGARVLLLKVNRFGGQV
jgi:tRNA(Ile)-lysidine synthase